MLAVVNIVSLFPRVSVRPTAMLLSQGYLGVSTTWLVWVSVLVCPGALNWLAVKMTATKPMMTMWFFIYVVISRLKLAEEFKKQPVWRQQISDESARNLIQSSCRATPN